MSRYVLWLPVLWLSGWVGMLQATPPPNGVLFPAGGQVGQTVSVAFNEKLDPWPVQVAVEGGGVKLIPTEEAGQFRLEIAPDAVPGLRWVRLYNAEGAGRPIPLMVGTLPELNEVEPNNSPQQAQTLPSSVVTINGRIDPGADVDVFAVTVQAGQTLVADVVAHCGLNSPTDATLQLLTPHGFVLAQNDDGKGLDPRLIRTATHDGTLLLRLLAFPAAPDQTIGLSGRGDYRYRLTVSTGPFIDYALPLVLQKGQASQVELVGWNLGQAALKKAAFVDGTMALATVFDVAAAGVVQIPLVEQATVIEVEPNDAAQPQTVPVPCVASGRIGEPRDTDVFDLQLIKDKPIGLRIASKQLGFLLTPLLTIKRADNGAEVFRQGDSGPLQDIDTTFKPAEDGIYHLSITDLAQNGSSSHAYRLTVDDKSDYELKLSASEYRVAAGQPLEIKVDIARQLDFADEIEVSIANLPEGATCEPVRSKPGDDSGKQVKLTLKAGATLHNGPLQIVGKSLGETASERSAQSSPAVGQPFTAAPWLTITAAQPTPVK